MSTSYPSSTSTIPIDVLTTIIPIVIAVAELAYIALGWKIYHEFGWKVYKFLGADRRIKKMYASYQIYECLLKFDIFFWVGFSVQFIWLVLQDTQVEYYITCAALPFSILLLVEGHLAARYEHRWMMATFMLGCVGAMVYFVYKVSNITPPLCRNDLSPLRSSFRCSCIRKKNLTFNSGNPWLCSVRCFLEISQLLTLTYHAAAVVSIAFLCATFVYSIIVLRNFGMGLKDACRFSCFGTTWSTAHCIPIVARKAQERGNHRKAASTHLNRMSIEWPICCIQTIRTRIQDFPPLYRYPKHIQLDQSTLPEGEKGQISIAYSISFFCLSLTNSYHSSSLSFVL